MLGKPTVIKFFAPVIEETIYPLLETIDDKMRHGAREFVLLIASPGGDAFYGLSAYNYLRGLPITLTTHNFGAIDSMGVVLFCSGSRRLSVPQARFLLHGVSVTFGEEDTLEEGQLEERLKEMRMDAENVAKVIAANTGKSVQDITNAMLARTVLNAEEAKAWGLVHDLKSQLFESGSELISIQCPLMPPSDEEKQCPPGPAKDARTRPQGKSRKLGVWS